MKKKVLALSLALSLFAITIVGGTLAYFMDSDSEINTFTVGNIDIDLTEPSWNQQEEHKLMPGKLIPKDPTVTVAEDSQDCYVFLEMELQDASIFEMMYNLDGTGYYSQGEFYGALFTNPTLRNEVVNKWFNGIDYENWKVMIDPDLFAYQGGPISLMFGYTGNTTDPKGAIMSANDTATLMTGFTLPAGITTEMIPYGLETFEMKFTAHAIQASGIADLDAAYVALFPSI